jgi:hypothetical protein
MIMHFTHSFFIQRTHAEKKKTREASTMEHPAKGSVSIADHDPNAKSQMPNK